MSALRSYEVNDFFDAFEKSNGGWDKKDIKTIEVVDSKLSDTDEAGYDTVPVHLVLKFTDGLGVESCWKRDGTYTSYDGHKFDGDAYEVVMQPVTKYEYAPKS